MMQNEVAILDVWILIQMVDAVGVEKRAASLDAVDDVAFLQQELGKICPILPGNAGDQRCLAFIHLDGSCAVCPRP